jgi:hypothetical protein
MNQGQQQVPQQERQASMVGPLNPPANPGNDVVERITENEVQVDGCNNPFATWIMEYEMPKNFKFAVQIDLYDGTTDSQDHVEIFQ